MLRAAGVEEGMRSAACRQPCVLPYCVSNSDLFLLPLSSRASLDDQRKERKERGVFSLRQESGGPSRARPPLLNRTPTRGVLLVSSKCDNGVQDRQFWRSALDLYAP